MPPSAPISAACAAPSFRPSPPPFPGKSLPISSKKPFKTSPSPIYLPEQVSFR